MYLKLALRNIRRSVRDYAIYFVTLLFGVMIFYAFNSIGSQQVLFDLESNMQSYQFTTVETFIGMFSGVIACVLGFLVLYSNRFLVRRRKREFGTYLVLGMGPGSVSRIVLYETALVGIASLGGGLLLGVVASQALSFFTAALFEVQLVHYQFVFSSDAFFMTLGCFAAIFVVVALFNAVSVGRFKLIDLLNAGSRNERVGVRNPWVCLAAFLASLGVLAWSYSCLIESGLVMLDDPLFMQATVGMLLGTLLLFWSLAGFLIAVVTRANGFYLRGLRMFTVRQFASKVNTAFASLWAVCVLLFFSITVFSCGMGMVSAFTDQVKESTPFDATLSAQVWNGPNGSVRSSAGAEARRAEMQEGAPDRLEQAESYGWSMVEPLRAAAPELWNATVYDWAQVDAYPVPGLTMGDLLDIAETSDVDISSLRANVDSSLGMEADVVGVSQFNDAMELSGRQPVSVGPGQALVANNMDISESAARGLAASGAQLDVAGMQLALQPEVIEDSQIEDNMMAATGLLLVVPDEAVDGLKQRGIIPQTSYLNVSYQANGKSLAENDEALTRIVGAAQPRGEGGFEKGAYGESDPYASLLWPVTRIITSDEMVTQASGMRMMVTYLALYIGFVFLIATAAILGIQQLSEATDSLPRYRALWRLGCDRSMLTRSLVAQTCLYFLAPLVVAACHSACAIYVLSGTLFDAFGTSMVQPIAMGAGLIALVYGGYLLVTCLVSRSMMSSSLRQ